MRPGLRRANPADARGRVVRDVHLDADASARVRDLRRRARVAVSPTCTAERHGLAPARLASIRQPASFRRAPPPRRLRTSTSCASTVRCSSARSSTSATKLVESARRERPRARAGAARRQRRELHRIAGAESWTCQRRARAARSRRNALPMQPQARMSARSWRGAACSARSARLDLCSPSSRTML